MFPQPKTIHVQFIEADENGAISAHTCDKLIVFPNGLFENNDESYLQFKSALLAVIDANMCGMTFNTV